MLGCLSALLVLFVVGVGAAFFIVFLESGADTGKEVLQPASAYPPGTVKYENSHNYYVVRTADGKYLALADLDAANRASARKCRVARIDLQDPTLPELLQKYGGKMSPQAAGSTFLFRENCNSAIYDFTGLRLDAQGPNLDRYPVNINEQGRLTVDVTKRVCTEREGAQLFAPIPCD